MSALPLLTEDKRRKGIKIIRLRGQSGVSGQDHQGHGGQDEQGGDGGRSQLGGSLEGNSSRGGSGNPSRKWNNAVIGSISH